MVDLLGYCQRFWLLPIKALTGFDPQVELQSLVNPIDPLVVSFKAFDVAQIQVAKHKTPVAVVVCQPQQPVGYLLVFGVLLGFIPITGLAH